MSTSSKTLTKAQIADQIHDQIGLPKKHCSACVESVFAHIKETLADGDPVKVSGFGVFDVRKKNGRVGRNPKTLSEVNILPRTVVTFRLSNLFKSEING